MLFASFELYNETVIMQIHFHFIKNNDYKISAKNRILLIMDA